MDRRKEQEIEEEINEGRGAVLLASRRHDNGQGDDASIAIYRRDSGELILRENDGTATRYMAADVLDARRDDETDELWAQGVIDDAALAMIPDDCVGASRAAEREAWGLGNAEPAEDAADDTEVVIVRSAEYYGPYCTYAGLTPDNIDYQDIGKDPGNLDLGNMDADGVVSLVHARRIVGELEACASAMYGCPILSHNQAGATRWAIYEV